MGRREENGEGVFGGSGSPAVEWDEEALLADASSMPPLDHSHAGVKKAARARAKAKAKTKQTTTATTTPEKTATTTPKKTTKPKKVFLIGLVKLILTILSSPLSLLHLMMCKFLSRGKCHQTKTSNSHV